MAQRIRLTWNRNTDIDTKFYRVYRSEFPTIQERNRQEFFVMKVEHPASPNPIKIEQEKPTRYSAVTYLLEHKNILLELGTETFPFILKVNDVQVFHFSLFPEEGRILFDTPLDLTDRVVIEEYTFDGIQVWDYGVEEEGKTYYGPEAKDLSAPDAPTNLQMSADYDRNRVVLRWESSEVNGKKFYYRIDAAVDNSRYSGLSEYRWASVKEPLADRPYLIERSFDGIEWRQIAKVRQNVFYEYMIDRLAPSPITGLVPHLYMYQNRNDAQVTLHWNRLVDTNIGQTALYRIRAANKVGAISHASDTVGPVSFQVGLKEIVVRRKENDGTLPTYEGTDAVTVGVVPADATTFSEDVVDNKEYMYGVFVVDRAGNHSLVTTVIVYVGDNTAPMSPMNLSATELQLVVG